MWHDYLPEAKIIGVDTTLKYLENPVDDIKYLEEDYLNINNFVKLVNKYNPEIIIDNFSHKLTYSSNALISIFSTMSKKSIYIIENLHNHSENLHKQNAELKNDFAKILTQLSLLLIMRNTKDKNPLFDDIPQEYIELRKYIDYIIFKENCCLMDHN